MDAVVRSEPIPCFLNRRGGTAAAAAEEISSDRRFRLEECEPADIPEAVRAAANRGARRIAVAGGDGTIAAAASVLAETDVELAIVPGGTLNHFSKRLGIPGSRADALDVAAECPSRLVDVGYVNDRLILNSSSVGAYIQYVSVRERWEPRFGYYLASVISAFRLLSRLPAYTVRLESQGVRSTYRTPIVVIEIGERNLQSPGADDPMYGERRGLHLLVLSGTSRRRMLAVLLKSAVRGLPSISTARYVDSFIVEECSIELPRSHPIVAVDGETARLASPLRYHLKRDALSVVCPTGQKSVSGSSRSSSRIQMLR